MASIQISRWRLRVEADVEHVGDPTYQVQNIITSQALSIPRANGCDFELGFFWDGSPLDCSVYSAITVNVWASQNSATLLMSATLGSGQFANLLDPVAWAAGTAQHAVFDFDSTQTNIDLGGADSVTYFLEVRAVVTATGDTVTLLEGAFSIQESQAERPDEPVPQPPDVPLSQNTANRTLVPIHGNAWRVAWSLTNGSEYHFDNTDNLWHRVGVQGGQWVVEQPGVAAIP